MSRRHLLLAVLALVASLVAVFPAAAQFTDWPAKPVRVVVGYPAGGPNDLIARAIGQKLNDAWKQPVIVENRPGASGITASEHVARSAPDGHTLMLTSITHAILRGLYEKLPFDPGDDFTPVSLVGQAPLVMVVHPSVPANSVKELIALAKARPGAIAYASTGNGTSIHISGEMFNRMAGINVMHVPYKGSAPAMTDLVGGQVQMMIEAMPSAMPHIRSGRLRALAVTSPTRSPELPDLPTVNEAGLPGFEVVIWWGMVAPAKLPRQLLDKLSAAVNATLATPDVRKRFAAFGAEPVGTTPEDFERVIRRDMQRYAAIIKEAGIRVD